MGGKELFSTSKSLCTFSASNVHFSIVLNRMKCVAGFVTYPLCIRKDFDYIYNRRVWNTSMYFMFNPIASYAFQLCILLDRFIVVTGFYCLIYLRYNVFNCIAIFQLLNRNIAENIDHAHIDL